MTQLVLHNPYDGSEAGRIEPDSDERMLATLEQASRAFQVWRQLPVSERCARVQGCLGYFREHSEELALEVSRQMGKPVREARAEVRTVLDRAETSLGLAESALAPHLLPEKTGFVRRVEHQPMGVVLAIAAWNYPLLIPINVIVPGLLAGNAILLKHSPLTWLTGRRFSEAFASLGRDIGADGLVADLVIDHEQAARLIADKRVAHVAFTGSVRGGREVYRTVAASRFIDVGLELGGKDAAYVAEDADLDFTVPNVVEGALYNAGQSCCAIERVYVHERRYDEFLQRAQAALADWVMGDPLADATSLGPLARAEALPFLAGQVAQATERGAQLIAGGHIAGRFFEPTLLGQVPQQADVMRSESFGPILPVARVTGDEQALALMDDSDFGLTASVWTRDTERAERLARELDVGTVFQNRCDYLDPALPWTGHRDSGKGSTLSESGFFHLTRRKSIHFRT